MLREVAPERKRNLDDYAAFAHLTSAVIELRREAALAAPLLRGRTVWMLNSTAEGGGVAEMLPRVVGLLNELGVTARWLVFESDQPEFFHFTKRLHNLIHGVGQAGVTAAEAALYASVSRQIASELAPWLRAGDLLVVHDPQPAAVGAELAATPGVSTIWRCHIGREVANDQTRAAWSFLDPYLTRYHHSVFTAAEYAPACLQNRFSVIRPGLDPLSHKNRELPLHKTVGVLASSLLIPAYGPLLVGPFANPALRVQPDGSLAPAIMPDDLGLLFRPIVSEISRWDRLKGFAPLLEAFGRLKRTLPLRKTRHAERENRALELARLVLAGPDPTAIQDDPQSSEVFGELVASFQRLEPEIKADVALLALPMTDRKTNALMINGIQRCSTVVVQNSLEEGFGLTVTEAMWKRLAVLGSSATGIRIQIRNGYDGVLVADAEDPDAIADALEGLLTDPQRRALFGQSAQRRVHDEFLVFTQLRGWLHVLTECAQRPAG